MLYDGDIVLGGGRIARAPVGAASDSRGPDAVMAASA